MEKTYQSFKKFLPVIFVLSFIGFVFGLFSLLYYYQAGTVSIDFTNVIPIFTIIFFGISLVVSLVFSFKIKSLHIKRIKKNSGFSKFASLLAATLVTALFLFDFIKFVITPSSLPTFKIIRLIVSIPLIVYLIIGIIPKTIKHKRIKIPKWLTPITSVCALAWCVLGLLAIYFWPTLPTTNLFKLMHMVYYVFAIIFFMSEVGFEMFNKGHRLYVASSMCLFVTTFVSTGSVMVAKFLGKVPGFSISEFEIFAAFALGIYALSKMIAVQQTIHYVMKKDRSRGHGHHHRHHHHASQSSETDAEKTDSKEA